MSIEQEKRWITGEEFGAERRRLIATGVPDDAPEFRELFARVRERDDYLYERYGKPLLESHRGEWIAITLDGQVFLGHDPGEVGWKAVATVGPGNFCVRRLAEFPGYEMLS